jgi:hypothetical protein
MHSGCSSGHSQTFHVPAPRQPVLHVCSPSIKTLGRPLMTLVTQLGEFAAASGKGGLNQGHFITRSFASGPSRLSVYAQVELRAGPHCWLLHPGCRQTSYAWHALSFCGGRHNKPLKLDCNNPLKREAKINYLQTSRNVPKNCSSLLHSGHTDNTTHFRSRHLKKIRH